MVDEELIVKYLAAEAEDHEMAMVEAWRKLSPENEARFRQLEKLWISSLAIDKKRIFDTDKAWKKVESKIASGQNGRVINIRRTWLAAASLALIIGISALVFNISNKETLMSLSSNGIEQKLKLSDGSNVILSEGNLVYPEAFKGNRRKLELLKGRAYFDVKRDSLKPFEIKAGSTSITVLGTGFEISNSDEFVTVKVHSGKVRFSTPSGERVLTAGMSSTYSLSGKSIETVEDKNDNSLSYATGSLVFRNTSLKKVAEDLNRYYKGNRIIVSEEMAACRITASFEKEELSSVLEVIKLTLEAEIQSDKQKGEYIIEGKGCLP